MCKPTGNASGVSGQGMLQAERSLSYTLDSAEVNEATLAILKAKRHVHI